MGIFDYSTTAGSNAAVGGVAITEGMARASVNNAMRAQLADLAKLLLDQGGAVATTGSANAYLVSLNSAPLAYANNMTWAMTLNHSLTGASTVNANSLGVKDFKKLVAGVATALASGDGPIGHIAICTYSSANNAVILLNPALISGAYVPGGTDVAIADGGTGQSTAILGFNALSPMTSRGDLIRGGVTGAERVALGAAATFLKSDGTDAVWAALSEIVTSMFAANVVDTDPTLGANSNTRLATQAAVKAYMDASASGINWAVGGAVACATTANITLSGEQTLDGVLTSASRVLVKNQTAPTENGIYVSAAGAWARATDADTGAEFIRLGVFVAGGTTQAGATYLCTRTTAPTLGVDNLVFNQNGASQVYTAGTGLGLTGNQFNITDAELLTWAGIAPSANVQSLVSAADYAAMRTLLGLVIGTNVQAFDADLTTWAGISPSANAQSLVSAVDYAAMKTLLTLGAADSPQFTALNIGHATDTTLTRVPGGNLAVEGNELYRVGGTNVALGDGGTGESTASDARTALGFADGTYTPTATALVNTDSVGALSGTYLRVGNTVKVGIRCVPNATSIGVTSTFELSLPVASNFTTTIDAIGVAVASESFGTVSSSIANNTLVVTYTAGSTTNVTMGIEATYTVM